MKRGRAAAVAACGALTMAACSLVIGDQDRRLAEDDAAALDARGSEPIVVLPDVAGEVVGADTTVADQSVAPEAGPDGGADVVSDAGADATVDAAPDGTGAGADAPADVDADVNGLDGPLEATPGDAEAGPPPGTLDPSFGTRGTVVTTIGRSDSAINALAIDGTGDLVVAGYSYTSAAAGHTQMTVARYTAAGAMDTTFGANGSVSAAVGTASSTANALIVGQGAILAIGPASSSGVDNGLAHIGLARFTPAGVADSTFGTGGSVIVDNAPGYPETPYGAAALADGRFTVVAAAQTAGGKYAEIARFSPSGTLDGTCNGGYGYELEFIQPPAETPAALVLSDPDSGAAVHVGLASNQGVGGAAYALRSGPDCTLDSTFGGTFDFSTGSDSANAAASAGTGYVLAGVSNAGPSSNVALARITAAGTADPAFGGDAGYVTTDVDGGQDDGRGVAVDALGRIVVAGANAVPGGADSQMVVLRYTSSGQLDDSFGAGGVVVVQPGNPSAANAVAIQADGRIVVGGYATVAKHKVFAVVRLNP